MFFYVWCGVYSAVWIVIAVSVFIGAAASYRIKPAAAHAFDEDRSILGKSYLCGSLVSVGFV
jgi:hypothetical protein